MPILTSTLTNGTREITLADGFEQIAIYVDSASTASATILGTSEFRSDQKQSTAAEVPAGTSLQFVKQAQNQNIVFTITAPSGCTVNIVGVN